METLKKRPGLQRKIGYRPHVKVAYYIAWVAIALIGLTSMYFLFSATFTSEELLLEGRLFLYLNMLLIFNLGICIFILHRNLSTEFHVYPDRVEISKGSQTTLVPYKNVAEVLLRDIPFCSSFCTVVLNDKTKHTFHMAIERSEYIVSSLHSYNSDLFDLGKLSRYNRTAVIADHAARRLEAQWRDWTGLTVKFLIYPSFLFAIYQLSVWLGANWGFQILPIYAWLAFILAHVLLGTAIHLVWEGILTYLEQRKLEKNPNNLIVDLKWERRWQVRAHWVYFGISLLTCVSLVVF